MSFALTSNDYVEYLLTAAAKIEANGEYVTALDAKTGDGDHWVNLNMGFQKVVALQESLRTLPLSDMFKKIGMTLMSGIGGSSGVLYGGSYLAAGKEFAGVESLDVHGVFRLLEVQLNSIMERGKAQPGWKTMIDSLYEGLEAMGAAMRNGGDDKAVLEALKQGSHAGMEHTREMEAVKGRASYQTNKGVGDLDPGAVTMDYQLQCLSDYIIENKL